jgi:hypothetical protein
MWDSGIEPTVPFFCHPERSEGSHEILRAKALRMTQRQVIRNKIGKSSELSRVNTPR